MGLEDARDQQMECLSPEQIVAYLRGGDTDARQVEAHVRGCPACGMELLFARETLRDVRPGVREARPSERRKPILVRRRRADWVPWLAAAAVLVMAILVAITSQEKSVPKENEDVVVQDPEPEPQPSTTPDPSTAPKPQPTPSPTPKPEVVTPRPAPKPSIAPKPPLAPEPKPSTPPDPSTAPKPPAPKPEPPALPRKPSRTVVQRPVVATVIRTVGAEGTVGKAIHEGETFATADSEFAAIDLVGHGSVYFNEKSRAEFTGTGRIVLHEGEMIGQMERGEEPAQVRTPEHEIEMETALFDLRVSKNGTDLTIINGRAVVGETRMRGPSMMSLRRGRTPYVRTIGAGFADWVPEKLGARGFTGWFEAEAAQTMKGFTAMAWDFASGAQAAVQTSQRGAAMAYRASLPVRGKYVAWVRVRQYEPKAVTLGLVVNNRRTPNVQLTGAEGMPWRWVGPVPLTSDRLELVLSALSMSAYQPGGNRRSYPVVVDLVAVSSDMDFRPPARLPEERQNYAFLLSEPQPK